MVCFLLMPSLTAEAKENLLAIGQGISSPAINSLPSFSNGYTTENPVGASYQQRTRLSLGIDDGADLGLMGAFGLGNGTYGMAIGYRDAGCENCDNGELSGAASGLFGGVGFGIGLREGTVSAGLLFNPTGTHRIGVVVDGSESETYFYGVGYSYVAGEITFTVDASQFDIQTESNNPIFDNNEADDVIKVTPGFSFRADMIALTLSYDAYINDTADRGGDIWGGIGVGGDQDWHLAFYADYVSDWNIIGTLFF